LNTEKTAIAIIAAGASIRMGKVKQNLMWDTRTLLQVSVENALQANSDLVFTILGANYEEILPTLNTYEIEVLENKQWRAGMGTSIALAADYAIEKGFDKVLMMLCDQPSVNAQYIEQLLTQANTSEAQVVASQYGDRRGVPAVFDKTILNRLLALDEDMGAKALLNQESTSIESISSPQPLFDIDTPQDYEAYKRLYL
jgi:molybdenum cofactor cytidylyltransferase